MTDYTISAGAPTFRYRGTPAGAMAWARWFARLHQRRARITVGRRPSESSAQGDTK
ncbi:hypothetical protein SK224_08140 [Microbacterium sp. BG28]|uniref:hypothetical protein n=1 Tax=Microbacterium sp. BG28 TaxID=3097356 RepID=UPI002A5B0D01|nr:hypothetical protein [Microbacterium sp. BG28]MDY0829097.1 hypothetical protein [Microbacterium sp. BG28]